MKHFIKEEFLEETVEETITETHGNNNISNSQETSLRKTVSIIPTAKSYPAPKTLKEIFEEIKLGDPNTIKALIEKDKRKLANEPKKSSLLDEAMKKSEFKVAKYLALNGGNHDDMFPSLKKIALIKTDIMVNCDKCSIVYVIRLKKYSVIFDDKFSDTDTIELSINGPVIFKEKVSVINCRIYKDLCNKEILKSIATNEYLQLGEVTFERGLECSDIQITGELHAFNVESEGHYYI